jgi:hypothetical protein
MAQQGQTRKQEEPKKPGKQEAAPKKQPAKQKPKK